MNTDTDRYSNDLTQLSSREQLSALMDGALPEDQTRFLLRRLQHDAELSDIWQRWRLAGEVMRGMTPVRQLPTDFAANVAAALQMDSAQPLLRATANAGRSRWLRWGGGAAMAAVLALVAVLVRPEAELAPASLPQVASTAPAPSHAPSQPPQPTPAAPAALAEAPAALVAAAAVATRPQRKQEAPRAVRNQVLPEAVVSKTVSTQLANATAPAAETAASETEEIVTRPWPRSALPQFGSDTMSVGFGDPMPRASAPNPFLPPVFSAPPKLLSDAANDDELPAPTAKPQVQR